MIWIKVKDELPREEYLCLICHYNNHMEIAYFVDGDWFVLSNSLGVSDEKIDREFWPDYWFELPESPIQ